MVTAQEPCLFSGCDGHKKHDGEKAVLHRLFIFQNIRDRAVEDEAQRIKGFCGDGFPLFHPVQRVGGYAVLEDQFVFGDSFLEQGIVKRLIGNQIVSLFPDFFGF